MYASADAQVQGLDFEFIPTEVSYELLINGHTQNTYVLNKTKHVSILPGKIEFGGTECKP